MENQPWMKMYITICPIEIGDFPASHVSFPGRVKLPVKLKGAKAIGLRDDSQFWEKIYNIFYI